MLTIGSFNVSILVIAGAMVGIGMAAIALRTLWRRQQPKAQPKRAVMHPNQPVFLFDNGSLLDASASGLQLLSNASPVQGEFQALQYLLRHDFPDLHADIASLEDSEERALFTLNGSSLRLNISKQGHLIRIALGTIDGADVDAHFAALARTAAAEELEALRLTCDEAPHLMWREASDGTLTWANRAYMTYLDRMTPSDVTGQVELPARRLFEDLPTAGRGTTKKRMSVQLADSDGEHWFDITRYAVGEETMHHATIMNELVRSENTRRDLMQTLSKTFAELSVGLAIFDSKRHLVMFNPALLDMTGLPFDFLSAHPTIDAVLNRLRDMRRLPEPRNYASWREQFLSLEAEAKRGTYSENWTLPDGQTFSVTGRPHPDGALAFIFEDISAEVSLTRHFRAEIETSQAVLDALPDAVAVFSSANTLIMVNATYRDMWDGGTEEDVDTLDLRAVMSSWKMATAPSPIWPKLEAFSQSFETRKAWSDQVAFVDGRQGICHITPLPNRMMMVRFEVRSQARAQLQQLVHARTHTAKIVSR